MARAEVPGAIIPAVRLGRMVALTKPSGGVRAATESDPRTTVLSVDGVGAYDHISRQSMLSALADRPELAGLIPFAALFYGTPSTYVWDWGPPFSNTARALRQLQPGVLATLLRPLDATASGTPPSTRAAEQAARFLRSEGFPAPNWAKLLEEDAAAPADLTTRPAPGERPGGQRTASKALHKRALETLFTELDPTSRALLSQGGDAASCAPTAFPTSADTRVPDDEFRVMLLRRLRLLLPLAAKRCACGGLLDVYGDHRSALRAPACSLLELPIEGPGDPTDGLEVALGELLAGHQPPVPSRL
eukprot:s1439_g10.t1